jgi:hypothetical protein
MQPHAAGEPSNMKGLGYCMQGNACRVLIIMGCGACRCLGLVCTFLARSTRPETAHAVAAGRDMQPHAAGEPSNKKGLHAG